MSNRKSIQYAITIFITIICMAFAFIGNITLESQKTNRANLPKNIESEWRQQAKFTLSDTTNRFNSDVTNKLVDPNDNFSLQNWAKRNVAGILNGGHTGDGFMVRIYYENGKLVGKFIWDGSPDCARDSFITDGRYLTDEPKLHHDPVQAQYIVDQMLLGQSTLNANRRYSWNFDGSPEYLEWDVIPSGVLGFSEEPLTLGGVNNEKFNKILICLGTQEDEVQSTFIDQFKTLDESIYWTSIVVYGSIIMCLFNLIIYIYLNKRIKRI